MCSVGIPIEIGAILTTESQFGRVAMHAVREEFRQQADASLPLWKVSIPFPCPNDAYERAMASAVARAVREGFTRRVRRSFPKTCGVKEERLAGTGLTPLFPLFGADTTLLAREMVTAGLGAVITCVDRDPRRSFGAEFGQRLRGSPPPL